MVNITIVHNKDSCSYVEFYFWNADKYNPFKKIQERYWNTSDPLLKDVKCSSYPMFANNISKTITQVTVKEDHDGCDRHGYKSNLYTVLFTFNDDTTEKWYGEEWFDGKWALYLDEDEGYDKEEDYLVDMKDYE